MAPRSSPTGGKRTDLPVRYPPDDVRPRPLPRRFSSRPAATRSSSRSRPFPSRLDLIRRIKSDGCTGLDRLESADAPGDHRAFPRWRRRRPGHERDAGIRRPEVRRFGPRQGSRSPGENVLGCGSRSTAGSSPTRPSLPWRRGSRRWWSVRASSAPMATTRRPWPSWPRPSVAGASEAVPRPNPPGAQSHE